MTLLFLAHRVPHPPNRGDRIRAFHLLQYLAELDEVHLACLADEPVGRSTTTFLSKLCSRLAVVPLRLRMRWLQAGAFLARGRSATEGLFWSRALHQTLVNWTSAIQYDAVVVFCSSMAPYLDISGLAEVPLVIDLVDVDSQKWDDYANCTSFPKSCLFRLESRRVRALESTLAARARAVTVVSVAEQRLLRSFCPLADIRTIINGVDLNYFVPQPSSELAVPYSCVFVGALDYRANIDGITTFCCEIWPEIRKHFSIATLQIVGRRPVPAVASLNGIAGVEVVGEVEDVRPLIRRAGIVIAPLRIARGIQNKVLEAAAMGKPIIGTRQSLEGLQLTDGDNVWRADEKSEWITAFVELWGNPSRAARMGAAARSYVEATHSWDRCLTSFRELIGVSEIREAPGSV